jgi:Bacterial protein of unknown function (DUF937)
MNLVKLITDQLSSDTRDKLALILGVNRESIESATTAAVPAILAEIEGLANQEDGIRQLTATLGGLDDTMFGNFDRLLSGDTGAMLQKGSGQLHSLLGDDTSNSLSTALSRFTGLSPSTIKSLLAYLTPLVLGRVASQWRNQGGTPAALRTLLVDQKRNIEDALPSGFAPDQVPGFSRLKNARAAATRAASDPESAVKPLASTLMPLALLIVAALLLWGYLHGRQQPQDAGVKPAVDASEEVVAMKPVVPDAAGLADAAQVKQQWTDVFTGLSTTFTEIKDGAAASAALPRLEELDRQIDTLRQGFDALPESGKSSLGTSLNEQIDLAKKQSAKVLSLPGLPEQVKSLIDKIVHKLGELTSTMPTT